MSQADTTPAFQLKGSMLAISILELLDGDLVRLDQELQEKIAQAADFFRHIPLVLALDRLPPETSLDLPAVQALCRQHGLRIMAVRTEQEEQVALAEAQHLTVLPPSGMREKLILLKGESETPVTAQEDLLKAHSKLVTSPVRGGMQVHGENGDLIVLAAVSTGAELLADGNIHVWGALRGKALAGIRGNQEARIFCQQLGAEMLCIAGIYKVGEDLRRDPCWGRPAQIMLVGGELKIYPL